MMQTRCLVGGNKVAGHQNLTVRSPYDGQPVGVVELCGRQEAEAAIETCLSVDALSTRYERFQILERTRAALEQRAEEFARLITGESGLCLKETRYEVGRALDVLRLAANEALRDDGQVF